MLAYTYIEHGKFGLLEKPIPVLEDARDAIVRVTLGSICTSDLHIKHGSVPRAVPGITVGHEMVGIVEQVGAEVESVKPGDRVTVNVETFCGKCFFCRHGYVNNCTDTNGGWALGCRIDGGQAEYVRVPYADQGLNRIPDTVSDEQALLVGDVLATGFWAARTLRNNRGRHCTHHRCRADGYLYPALFHAEEAPSHYCLRAVGRKNPFCPRALSGGAGHWAGKLQRLCEEA